MKTLGELLIEYIHNDKKIIMWWERKNNFGKVINLMGDNFFTGTIDESNYKNADERWKYHNTIARELEEEIKSFDKK